MPGVLVEGAKGAGTEGCSDLSARGRRSDLDVQSVHLPLGRCS